MQRERLEVPGLQRHLQFPFDLESAPRARQAMPVAKNDAVGFRGCRAGRRNSDARAATMPLRNAFVSGPSPNWKQTRPRKMIKNRHAKRMGFAIDDRARP